MTEARRRAYDQALNGLLESPDVPAGAVAPPDSRTAAVDLARRKFKVFRTNSVTLRPMKPRFWEYASDDPEQVYKDFTGADGESVPDNVAILTGDWLYVVDEDVKDGKEGAASIAKLVEVEGLSLDTFTVNTPSGGRHLFYSVDPAFAFRNRQHLRPGVDTRGEHGYVNAIGSIKPNGGTYTLALDRPIAPLCEALVAELRAGRTANAAIEETDAFEDDWSIGQAIEFLHTAEPKACAGDHHDALIRIGHVLFDLGITRRLAAELVEEHWAEALAVTDDVAYQFNSLAEGRCARGKPLGCVASPKPPQRLPDLPARLPGEPRR